MNCFCQKLGDPGGPKIRARFSRGVVTSPIKRHACRVSSLGQQSHRAFSIFILLLRTVEKALFRHKKSIIPS